MGNCSSSNPAVVWGCCLCLILRVPLPSPAPWHSPFCRAGSCSPLLCSHRTLKGNTIVFFCSGCVYVCMCVCACVWKALSYRYFYNLKQLQLSAQRQAVTSWFMYTVYVYVRGEGGRQGRWGSRRRWVLIRNLLSRRQKRSCFYKEYK